MAAKYTWTETFLSLEGEAIYTGIPTVYARFTKCNFECRGFNNPDNLLITNEVLGYNPKDMISLEQLPPIEIGCDSIYAWDDRFKHLWRDGSADDLIDELEALLPHNQWVHPVTHQPNIFSITGGEPTLRAKFLPELFHHPRMSDCEHILIETNCSVPLTQKFIDEIGKWLEGNPNRRWSWSNSPKLKISGEDPKKAICPDVAMMQRQLVDRYPHQADQYFKFVVSESDDDFDEIESVMALYWSAGIPQRTQIFCMPMCCTQDQQDTIAQQVADKCIQRGMIFCYRVHNAVYANAIGK